ncbi:MAG: HAD family hydrolase [Dehalococcoidia bacterium]
MVKAVFFDLVNTLIHHDPLPEERQHQALKQFNIELSKENLRRGFWAANDFFSRESARAPVEARSEEKRLEVFIQFEQIWLSEAGFEASRELAVELLKLVRSDNPGVAPFEDAVPALTELRKRGLAVGLVSNLDTTLERFCPDFDLAAYLDFAVISHEVGFEKPHPQIFELALSRAGATASEALMVGDQFHSDIMGALGIGIKPLWLDRDGVFDDHRDCQRIGGLMEIMEHI